MVMENMLIKMERSSREHIKMAKNMAKEDTLLLMENQGWVNGRMGKESDGLYKIRMNNE